MFRYEREKWPHPRDAGLNQSWILPGPFGEWELEQGGATESQEGPASESLLRGWHQALRKMGGMDLD